MNRRKHSYAFKIMMLISTLLLMMFLCGCRTRISNNTEISQTLADDGMMSESYQVRRDELGIPVAEAPFFSLSGSGNEEYEDYEDEYDDSEEYDDEEDLEEDEEDLEDEEFEDEDEEDAGSRTTSTSRTSTTSHTTGSTVTRRYVSTTPTAYKVTLNLNAKDAKCSRSSIMVRKGSLYGSLPTPTRSGYTFKGWYTAKTKGTKISSKTKVTKSSAHTIYAQWTKTEKKTYTITFDGNGEGDNVELSSSKTTVQEGGTYGDLPSAKREKYTFKGWYTDSGDGTKITSDTKFTANKNQTLYAHWTHDPYAWWNNEFTKAANAVDEESQFAVYVEDGNEKQKKFVTDCKDKVVDSADEADYVVKFIDDYSKDKAKQEAADIHSAYDSEDHDVMVIIISKRAVYGEKEETLLYKMWQLSRFHGGGYDIDEAKYDLLDGKDPDYYDESEQPEA